MFVKISLEKKNKEEEEKWGRGRKKKKKKKKGGWRKAGELNLRRKKRNKNANK